MEIVQRSESKTLSLLNPLKLFQISVQIRDGLKFIRSVFSKILKCETLKPITPNLITSNLTLNYLDLGYRVWILGFEFIEFGVMRLWVMEFLI